MKMGSREESASSLQFERGGKRRRQKKEQQTPLLLLLLYLAVKLLLLELQQSRRVRHDDDDDDEAVCCCCCCCCCPPLVGKSFAFILTRQYPTTQIDSNSRCSPIFCKNLEGGGSSSSFFINPKLEKSKNSSSLEMNFCVRNWKRETFDSTSSFVCYRDACMREQGTHYSWDDDARRTSFSN